MDEDKDHTTIFKISEIKSEYVIKTENLVSERGLNCGFFYYKERNKTAASAEKGSNLDYIPMVKCLLLKFEGGYLGVILKSSDEIDLKKIRRYYEYKDLRMATPEEVYEILEYKLGSVPITSFYERKIVAMVDKNLLKEYLVVGTGGDEQCGMKFNPREVIKRLKYSVRDLIQKNKQKSEINPPVSKELINKEFFPKEVYHLTSLENMNSIFNNGILSRENIRSLGLKVEDLSYPLAQSIRGGKEFVSSENNKLGVHQCVPFYFAKDSPSNYLMWRDKKDHKVALLVIDFVRLINSNIEFLFSDGGLAKSKKENKEVVNVYSCLQDLDKLDWWVINYEDHQYFMSTVDMKKDKMAEFLVRDLVKPEFIKEIIVCDNELKIEVLGLLSKGEDYSLDPNAKWEDCARGTAELSNNGKGIPVRVENIFS